MAKNHHDIPRIVTPLFAALLLAPGNALASDAQDPDGTRIVQIAVQALRGDFLPDGPITVDPRPVVVTDSGLVWGEEAPPERAEGISRAVGNASVLRVDET